MVKRPCKACQKRRKLLEAKLLAKQAKGKKVQAAAIGAVLAVTEAVGQSLGIGEDTENEQVWSSVRAEDFKDSGQ